jgi:hypothetical protein
MQRIVDATEVSAMQRAAVGAHAPVATLSTAAAGTNGALARVLGSEQMQRADAAVQKVAQACSAVVAPVLHAVAAVQSSGAMPFSRPTSFAGSTACPAAQHRILAAIASRQIVRVQPCSWLCGTGGNSANSQQPGGLQSMESSAAAHRCARQNLEAAAFIPVDAELTSSDTQCPHVLRAKRAAAQALFTACRGSLECRAAAAALLKDLAAVVDSGASSHLANENDKIGSGVAMHAGTVMVTAEALR